MFQHSLWNEINQSIHSTGFHRIRLEGKKKSTNKKKKRKERKRKMVLFSFSLFCFIFISDLVESFDIQTLYEESVPVSFYKKKEKMKRFPCRFVFWPITPHFPRRFCRWVVVFFFGGFGVVLLFSIRSNRFFLSWTFLEFFLFVFFNSTGFQYGTRF